MKAYPYRAWILVSVLALTSSCASGPEHEKKDLTKTERAQLFLNIGNGALVEGDAIGALQNYARAELEDSNLAELHHSKALAFFAKHDLDNALRSARRAVEIKPDYSDANNTLGKLLIDAGKYSEATQRLEMAAHDSLYRGAYKAWTNLGILNYRHGEYTQAELFFSRAIRDSPMEACIAYYYRGHIKLRAEKFDDAVQDYGRATKKRCAQFGEAQLALGLAYGKSRQFDLARKTFLEIQKRYPNTKLAEQALDQLRYLP